MSWRPTTRPPWDAYFMQFAKAAATRGTCKRLKVGAVVVLDHQVVATGYNGSAPGQLHCEEADCDMEDGHCVRTIHAEMNALVQAAKHGVKIEGATIYTTAAPCWNCFRVLLGAGIKRYVYGINYRFHGAAAERIMAAAERAKVTLEKAVDCWHCGDTGQIGPSDDVYECPFCPSRGNVEKDRAAKGADVARLIGFRDELLIAARILRTMGQVSHAEHIFEMIRNLGIGEAAGKIEAEWKARLLALGAPQHDLATGD